MTSAFEFRYITQIPGFRLDTAIVIGSLLPSLIWGVAFGSTIFVSFWLLTALYVRRANTEFDALTEEIVREARAAEHAAGNREAA